MSENTRQVQNLYQRRPYPHYPLLAKPRWQDGYLGSSLFAHQIVYGFGIDASLQRRFLSIGSGEILPYVIRQWEPSSTQVACVDLSSRSLRRAQFRTALLGRRISFHCDDINSLLLAGELHDKRFDHIEAYGVLHHIPSFKKTLGLIREHLTETGTVRIMVYNRHARDWIWSINRAFATLGLKFESNADVHTARQLLKTFAKTSPRLGLRLSQLGESSLENDTRFADTFLHPWESRASINEWFAAIDSADLEPVALHDRYAELDDLPNPLWACPSAHQLTERAQDLRFENNLELWLAPKTKNRRDFSRFEATKRAQSARPSTIPLRLRLTTPPANLVKFREIEELTFGGKITIWQGFLKALHNKHDPTSTNFIRNLDFDAAARLARIGLILPGTAESAGRLEELLKPMVDQMSPPFLPPSTGTENEATILRSCLAIQSSESKARHATRRFILAI